MAIKLLVYSSTNRYYQPNVLLVLAVRMVPHRLISVLACALARLGQAQDRAFTLPTASQAASNTLTQSADQTSRMLGSLTHP